MREKIIDFKEDYNKLTYKGKDSKEYTLYLKDNEISIFHKYEYAILNQMDDLFDESTISKIINEIIQIKSHESPGWSSVKIKIQNTRDTYKIDSLKELFSDEKNKIKSDIISLIKKENPNLYYFNNKQEITYLNDIINATTEIFVDGVSTGHYKFSPDIMKKIEANLTKESDSQMINKENGDKLLVFEKLKYDFLSSFNDNDKDIICMIINQLCPTSLSLDKRIENLSIYIEDICYRNNKANHTEVNDA